MFDGGYLRLNKSRPLFRTGPHKHTEIAGQDAVPDAMLEAINVIQAVPWRINPWLLDILRTVVMSNQTLGVIPPHDPEPPPPNVPEEIWRGLSDEERKRLKQERVRLHRESARGKSKRLTLLRKLDVATTLKDRPAIWFPHFVDFRGRMYPMPQDLHPQGDDVAKGLLEFSVGKPLGKSGLYWLAIRLANTAGQDKLSFEDRLAWVVENEALIFDSANAPLDGTRFWTQADEPWGFLATCREWTEAHKLSRPEEYVSRLPIPLDGTANGLQHLSLMGRDPAGALATCCRPGPRRDIYQEVAAAVKRIVADDAVRGVEEAQHWIAGEIGRATVKRAVMTTPYGVTARGIQEQLVTDGHCEGIEGSTPKNSAYLRDVIINALSETVKGARDIMAYFQDTASALADAGLPLRWRTPMGMEVVQAYNNFQIVRTVTLLGRFQMIDENTDVGLDKRKQVLASAPNIVHSFDAAMLAATALRCRAHHGITNFAFIHDSYGTHACDTNKLADALRTVAFQIYQTDRLSEFAEYSARHAPGVELPSPPPLGDWDIREVMKAEYFFA